MDDIVTFYAGANGGVQQNSYANSLIKTHGILPQLDIKPILTQYNAYAGMKENSTTMLLTTSKRLIKPKMTSSFCSHNSRGWNGKPFLVTNMATSLVTPLEQSTILYQHLLPMEN